MIESKKRPLKNFKLLLAILISTGTMIFIACLSMLYCWEQNKQRKNTIIHRVARGDDTEPSSSWTALKSLQTLNDILHGNIIHQGVHSVVRLGAFESKTVAIKVFPPRSKEQWHNENKIYNMLGDHPNIAQVLILFMHM